METIGIVDTMFARIDMGGLVLDELKNHSSYGTEFGLLRRTVPGFKDLAVAAKRLIEIDEVAIVVALGMPGGAELDRACAHEAAIAIAHAQLMTNTHILEVFVHQIEGEGDDRRLEAICDSRCRQHALNAVAMLLDPDSLVARAGQGIRQGGPDAGPIATTTPQ